MNTPIINNTDIPEGMKIIENYLVEKDGGMYQVDYGNGKEEGSFMLLTLEDNPVTLSGKKINQYIKKIEKRVIS